MPNDLSRELAARFQVVGRFFTEIGNEADAERLLDCMVGNDAKTFGQFLDRLVLPGDFDIPRLGKCIWLSELIEVAVVELAPREYSATRLDLTRQEKLLRTRCIRANPRSGRVVKKDAFGFEREIIENQGLLECMEKNGLVERVTIYEKVNSIILTFGVPQAICV